MASQVATRACRRMEIVDVVETAIGLYVGPNASAA